MHCIPLESKIRDFRLFLHTPHTPVHSVPSLSLPLPRSVAAATDSTLKSTGPASVCSRCFCLFTHLQTQPRLSRVVRRSLNTNLPPLAGASLCDACLYDSFNYLALTPPGALSDSSTRKHQPSHDTPSPTLKKQPSRKSYKPSRPTTTQEEDTAPHYYETAAAADHGARKRRRRPPADGSGTRGEGAAAGAGAADGTDDGGSGGYDMRGLHERYRRYVLSPPGGEEIGGGEID